MSFAPVAIYCATLTSQIILLSKIDNHAIYWRQRIVNINSLDWAKGNVAQTNWLYDGLKV